MTTKDQVKELSNILDALIKAENADNDEWEAVHDRELSKVSSLVDGNILHAIKAAVGDNSGRKKVSIFLLAQLYNVEGVDQVFLDVLNSSDVDDRMIIIEVIGLRKLITFVPVLNALFLKETDVNCKAQIITTLGNLADESSFPIFLDLIEKTDARNAWRLVWALKNFAKPEAKPFLEKVFNDEQTETSDKVVSAWGLVKIGERKYYDFLVEMLDDPDLVTPTSHSPGQSLRAAQAICDINGWDFVWNKDRVFEIKKRLRSGESTIRISTPALPLIAIDPKNNIDIINGDYPPDQTTLKGYISRNCDVSIYYDKKGCKWTSTIYSKEYKRSVLTKLLALTFYNPTIKIERTWTKLEEYGLSELKERVNMCIDADDDVLTQFVGAAELKTYVTASTSFDEIVKVLLDYVFKPNVKL